MAKADSAALKVADPDKTPTKRDWKYRVEKLTTLDVAMGSDENGEDRHAPMLVWLPIVGRNDFDKTEQAKAWIKDLEDSGSDDVKDKDKYRSIIVTSEVTFSVEEVKKITRTPV